MALTKDTYVIGTHAYFQLEGAAFTSPVAGVVGRESKPDASDTGWIDLGVIEDAEDNLTDTEIEVYKASPGRLRLYDVINVKDKLTIKVTCKELSPLAVQTLYRCQPLTPTSTQFNPLGGKSVKGWLKIQRYDQNDQQRMIMDVYVRLKVSSAVKFGGDALAETEFEALVLQSTQNTATL